MAETEREEFPQGLNVKFQEIVSIRSRTGKLMLRSKS
jgi:hypothetical protein